MKDINKSYLFASFTIIFWGTSASAFKIGLRHIDYFQLLFIWIILGEKIFITTLFGLILIIAGIFVQQLKRKTLRYEK